MKLETLSLLAVDRTAVATNRGFYFQYLAVLKKWLENYIDGNDVITYTEVDDDIKEVGNQLIFTQVKCYSSSFSFTSPEIKKCLRHFFYLFLKEKQNIPDLKFIFLTNSSISPKEKHLSNWINQQQSLSIEVKKVCSEKIKGILRDEINEAKRNRLNNSKLRQEEKMAIKTAFNELTGKINDTIISDFIDVISWEFSGQSPEKAIEALFNDIQNLLSNSKFNKLPVDVLTDVLLSEIYRCSQLKDPEKRKLTSETLSGLLHKTTTELESLINKQLVTLLGSSNDSITLAIKEIQHKQLSQDQKLDALTIKFDSTTTHEIPKGITHIPFLNASKIFGRTQDCTDIRSALLEHNIIFVHGTGGIGKTTVLKLYVETHFSDYSHIMWISAGKGVSEAILSSEEIPINLAIEFPEGEKSRNRITRILKKFGQLNGTKLIVIDNFNESTVTIQPLTCLERTHVLISSRIITREFRELTLGELDFKEASKIFKEHCPLGTPTESEMQRFFSRIEYNTLVIELVAKTIRNSLDLTLSTFVNHLETLQMDDPELGIAINMLGVESPVFILPFLEKTFELSELNKFERYYLSFLALLPSDDIKISELIEWCGNEHEKTNKNEITNVINSLHQKGWLFRNGDLVCIHKIVRDTIIYIQRNNINPYTEHVLHFTWLSHRLSEGFQSDGKKSLRFLKYAESIIKVIKEPFRKSIYQPLLIIENEILTAQRQLMIETDTIPRWQSLLERATGNLGKNDELVGVICNNYALALIDNGFLDEGKVLFDRAFSILNNKLPKTINQLLQAMNNKCRYYVEKGDFTSYRKLGSEILKLRREYNVANDELLVAQFNTIALANQYIGNHVDAISYFKKAIKTHKDLAPGKRNDLNLAFYLINLSQILYKSDKKDEAVSNLEEAVTIFESHNLNNNKIVNTILKSLYNMYLEINDLRNVEIIGNKIIKNNSD